MSSYLYIVKYEFPLVIQAFLKVDTPSGGISGLAVVSHTASSGVLLVPAPLAHDYKIQDYTNLECYAKDCSGAVPDCHGVTQNGSGSSSVTSPALVLVETPNESVCGGTVVSTKMNGRGSPRQLAKRNRKSFLACCIMTWNRRRALQGTREEREEKESPAASSPGTGQRVMQEQKEGTKGKARIPPSHDTKCAEGRKTGKGNREKILEWHDLERETGDARKRGEENGKSFLTCHMATCLSPAIAFFSLWPAV
ncbi:hypothetical protein NFI96_010225 [Prochilodus magdalenae]|nr:hypothetical protein NFI96_010225 [Prochilodus magdalenae]